MQPDMSKMMQALSKAQEGMMRAQKELETATVEGQAGGGAIKIITTGDFNFKSIKISPDAVDTSYMSMLEDLVLTAINDAVRKAQDLHKQKLTASMGGLNLPPGFGL